MHPNLISDFNVVGSKRNIGAERHQRAKVAIGAEGAKDHKERKYIKERKECEEQRQGAKEP